MTPVTPEWIALDWGTSNLRGWAMRGAEMLDHRDAGTGMGALARDGYGAALAQLIEGWQANANTPIIACGMVGARQGWVEAAYRTVPCRPLSASFTTVPSDSACVQIIAGLSQTTPADVMRGEETQIAGFLALNPDWDGVICLPGTHTKWAEVSAGEVVSFQTFLTGEMFDLLSNSSVLRHSVGAGTWDKDAFVAAVADTLSRPERLAANLFGLRAKDLLHGMRADATTAQLSGLLIGSELAAARPYWLGRQIAVIGGAQQTQAYAAALEAQGVPVILTDAERMTVAGLTAAYRLWKDTA